MIDKEVFGSDISPDRFPFPSRGDVMLAVRSADYTLGPVILHLDMKAGSTIPVHMHEGVAEVLYVIEGDFTNEGNIYKPGDSLHIKAGHPHGPHGTRNGCKMLVLWTEKPSTERPNRTALIPTLATETRNDT